MVTLPAKCVSLQRLPVLLDAVVQLSDFLDDLISIWDDDVIDLVLAPRCLQLGLADLLLQN